MHFAILRLLSFRRCSLVQDSVPNMNCLPFKKTATSVISNPVITVQVVANISPHGHPPRVVNAVPAACRIQTPAADRDAGSDPGRVRGLLGRRPRRRCICNPRSRVTFSICRVRHVCGREMRACPISQIISQPRPSRCRHMHATEVSVSSVVVSVNGNKRCLKRRRASTASVAVQPLASARSTSLRP
jgi:hypothetical protein